MQTRTSALAVCYPAKLNRGMLHAGATTPKVELPKKRGKVKQEPEAEVLSAEEEEEEEEDVADASGSDAVSEDAQQEVERDPKRPQEGANLAGPPSAGASKPGRTPTQPYSSASSIAAQQV